MLPTIHKEATSYAATKSHDDEATARVRIDRGNKTINENGHTDLAPRDKGRRHPWPAAGKW
jgi:hypothetical protein